jgi:hypothetical protein
LWSSSLAAGSGSRAAARSAASAAIASPLAVHSCSSAGSMPTSCAAPAIVAGSSGSSPPMTRTRRARSSASWRSGAKSRAATTAAHAGAEAAERGRSVASIGIPNRRWIMPKARAWASGGKTFWISAASSDSTTIRSVQASWSPYSQRRRQRCGSAENAHGHVGSVKCSMATVATTRAAASCT